MKERSGIRRRNGAEVSEVLGEDRRECACLPADLARPPRLDATARSREARARPSISLPSRRLGHPAVSIFLWPL